VQWALSQIVTATAWLNTKVFSMLCAIAATLVAAFFLYDPTYSLYVSNPLEIGELIIFAVAALIAAKCTADLTRPSEKRRIRSPRRRVRHCRLGLSILRLKVSAFGE
jgi:K+-sensing histidine kinase KdpD